jgi:hypothetical protein
MDFLGIFLYLENGFSLLCVHFPDVPSVFLLDRVAVGRASACGVGLLLLCCVLDLHYGVDSLFSLTSSCEPCLLRKEGKDAEAAEWAIPGSTRLMGVDAIVALGPPSREMGTERRWLQHGGL